MDKHCDVFYHYDSTSQVMIDGIMKILVPADGMYWISLGNIAITFSNGANPDTSSGFLVITGTQSNQSCSISSIGVKMLGKVIFPLTSPGTNNPTCRVYTRVELSTVDDITFSYYNANMTVVPTDRIVVTMHISTSADVIRDTLG